VTAPRVDRLIAAARRTFADAVNNRGGLTVPIARLAGELSPEVTVTIDFPNGEGTVPVVVVVAPSSPVTSKLAKLSPRQREIAHLIGRGLMNAEIALELGISVATVKDHVHAVLHRTGLRTRTQLAAALSSGLGAPGNRVGDT
jgi:two-component system, NarL family, nitrate/nitrite response regulator NarL